MSDAPAWEESIDPTLLERLMRPLSAPGIISPVLARRILGWVEYFSGRLPLLGEIRRRHGGGGLRVNEVPIVHGRRVSVGPGGAMPRAVAGSPRERGSAVAPVTATVPASAPVTASISVPVPVSVSAPVPVPVPVSAPVSAPVPVPVPVSAPASVPAPVPVPAPVTARAPVAAPVAGSISGAVTASVPAPHSARASASAPIAAAVPALLVVRAAPVRERVVLPGATLTAAGAPPPRSSPAQGAPQTSRPLAVPKAARGAGAMPASPPGPAAPAPRPRVAPTPAAVISAGAAAPPDPLPHVRHGGPAAADAGGPPLPRGQARMDMDTDSVGPARAIVRAAPSAAEPWAAIADAAAPERREAAPAPPQAAPAPQPAPVDLELLADRVQKKLLRRIAAERERTGGGRG